MNRFVRGEVCAACDNSPDKWRDLGIELIPGEQNVKKLNEIKVNHQHNVTQCCSAMFDLWRQTQPNANWNQLIKALKVVQLNVLAADIEKKLLPSAELQYTGNQPLTQQPVQVQEDQNMMKEGKVVMKTADKPFVAILIL